MTMATGTPKTESTEPQRGKFVIGQKPNAPQIIAVVALIVYIIASGWLRDGAFTVFVISLTIWAYLEVASGVNWLRRVFGIIGLIVVAVSLFERLHG